MNARMAVTSSLTLVKLPRRMAWRVMMPKKISTRCSQEPLLGVKCRVIRGVRSSSPAAKTQVLVGEAGRGEQRLTQSAGWGHHPRITKPQGLSPPWCPAGPPSPSLLRPFSQLSGD
jgi:hypothetical protein